MKESQKLTICQWAKEDRPREKMMVKGADALSDAELLAILIGSGNTEESAVELMRRILVSCHNDLNDLLVGKCVIILVLKDLDRPKVLLLWLLWNLANGAGYRK